MEKFKRAYRWLEGLVLAHQLFVSVVGGAAMTGIANALYDMPLPMSLTLGIVVFVALILALKSVALFEADKAYKEARTTYFAGVKVDQRKKRLKLLASCRTKLASHDSLHDHSFDYWITQQPEFLEIRPHLSEKMIKMLISQNGYIYPPGTGLYFDGKKAAFADELDRLEREWKLV